MLIHNRIPNFFTQNGNARDLKLKYVFPQLETLRHSIAKLERVVSFAAEEVHVVHEEVRVVHEENLRVAAELETLR